MKRMYENRVIAEFMRVFIMWWMIIKNLHKPSCWPRPINFDINDKRCFIGFTYRDDPRRNEKIKAVWTNGMFNSDDMEELFDYIRKIWKCDQ